MVYIAISLLISGLGKGVQWWCQFRAFMDKHKSGTWWDSQESWRLKYKNKNPKEGPAFPGSTGPLVFLTDGFHLFQMISETAWQIALLIALNDTIKEFTFLPHWLNVLLVFATIKLLYGGGFQLTFEQFHHVIMTNWKSTFTAFFADAGRSMGIAAIFGMGLLIILFHEFFLNQEVGQYISGAITLSAIGILVLTLKSWNKRKSYVRSIGSNKELTHEIIDSIYELMELMGASPMELGTIGSWGDTLEDHEILSFLQSHIEDRKRSQALNTDDD